MKLKPKTARIVDAARTAVYVPVLLAAAAVRRYRERRAWKRVRSW